MATIPGPPPRQGDQLDGAPPRATPELNGALPRATTLDNDHATAGRLSIRLQWPSPGAIRADPKVESRA